METNSVSTCVHRWRIHDTDGSRQLPGTCTHCGATRVFDASGTVKTMPYGFYRQRAEMAEYERVARDILV